MKILSPPLWVRRTVWLFLYLACGQAWATDDLASTLFADAQSDVFQIRVVDVGSGDKYTIGSGFRVSSEGHIATNFHVVSAFVHEPEKFYLEYVTDTDEVFPAELLTVDVVHDLALLKSAQPSTRYLPLSQTGLSNGERIFSIGNPHDLGMTIVEGNYNGLLQHSRYRKILFSGSLNAGMSGGPALNQQGEIIGVNVSTGGEQISFLVPVSHLSVLLEQGRALSSPEYSKDALGASLLRDQATFYQEVLSQPFETEKLGDVRIARNLSESLKCWGHSVDDEEDDKPATYRGAHQHCQSEDRIYLSDRLYLGEFYYDYEWITTERLGAMPFYHYVEQRFVHNTPNSSYSLDDVSDYVCTDGMVELSQQPWKVSTCFRQYHEYTGLYDASLLLVSTRHSDKALIAKIGASGISRENAVQIFRRFMEAIEWTE